jgi:hypothetical protein
MNRNRGWSQTHALMAVSLAVLGAGAAGFGQAKPQPPGQKEAIARFNKTTAPLLEQKCVPCHNEDDASGGVDFEKLLTGAKALADQGTMERALINLRSKTMPPVTAKPLNEADRVKLMTGIHDLLKSECSIDDPGRVTIRRLNRFEYANTIRDLMGVDFNPAADFPSDDVGYGFDNIGDVLSLSPLHLEKYLSAAEKVTELSLSLPSPKRQSVDLAKMKLGQGVGLQDTLIFFSQGAATHPLSFPEKGSYRLRITAYQDKAGPEDSRISVGLDQTVVDTFTVAALQDKPTVYEIPWDAPSPGQRTLTLRFLNDFYREGVGDRNLHVTGVEVEGPLGTGAPSPLRRQLIPAETGGGLRESAKANLRAFASRAYRRPITDQELARIMKLFDAGVKEGAVEDGVKTAVQGILVSPSFLFRVELDSSGTAGKAQALNSYDLASRLSYFLWGTLPDDQLLADAAAGRLATDKGLLEAVDRMMKAPKIEALGDSFAMQWLELERITNRSPDPSLFPGWSAQLGQDMIQETKLFFMDVVRNDRSVLDFIDGPYTFVNQRLAKHYGIPGPSGDRFERVSLAGTPRGGLLTQGSILTVTSNPTRTSPVKRGKWVLDVILNAPPPPPPPGVDEIKPDIQGQPLTVREKVELHRKNPACAVCHQKMDPLGFGLENFDVVGAWRNQDMGQPIDSSGSLPGNVNFKGPVELKSILRNRGDEFAQAFASRLLTYALGRGMRSADRCFVEEIAAESKKSGYTFSSFVRAIVLSEPFRKKTSRKP